jgi:hypothetical protein
VSAPFEFVVSDTFLIEGRGLILAPFFPVDRYRFDSKERVRVATPEGRVFEAEAEFEIPLVTPKPQVFQFACLLRSVQKPDVPIGSRVFVLTKTAAQIENIKV